MIDKVIILNTFILFCLRFSIVHSAKELPSFFPTCYRNAPDTNECILKATETMRPYLQKGIPELSIPPISPFVIPELTISLGTNSLNGKLVAKDLKLSGLDNYKFKKFDFDADKLYFDTALEMGEIGVVTDFQIQGKILSFPLEANGRIHGVVETSNGTLTQHNKLVTRKGVTHIAPLETVVKLKFGPTHIKEVSRLQFANGENIELETALIRAIEENSAELMEEFRPAVEEIMTKIILEILLKSIYKIPFDKLYPKLAN